MTCGDLPEPRYSPLWLPQPTKEEDHAPLVAFQRLLRKSDEKEEEYEEEEEEEEEKYQVVSPLTPRAVKPDGNDGINYRRVF